MTTMLRRIGDDLGLILDSATLKQFGITEETPVLVTMADDGILLRPIRQATDDQLETITDRIMTTHAETLHKLAQ